MIKVYCQYTVSGFKIFNTLAFPHKRGNDLYVKMGEVSQALKQEGQKLLVTSKYKCGLPPFAVNLFGTRDAQVVLINDREQTLLFLSHSESSLAYAFVAEDNDEGQILRTMACLWVQDNKSLLSRLRTLTEKIIEGDEPVLMFHKGGWETLCEEIKNCDTRFDSTLHSVHIGKKNLLVNNIVGKGRILSSIGINKHVASFVFIPGNDTVANMERRQRIIKYTIAITAASLFVIGSIAMCCGTK